MIRVYLATGLLAAPAVACVAQEPPDPGAGATTGDAAVPALISFEPAAPKLRAAARLYVPTGARPLLFEGVLAATHLSQIRRGSLSQTLQERWVSSVTWQSAGGWWISPNGVLAPGAYSVATAVDGLVEQFEVVDVPPVLRRVWPVGETLAGRDALYCGDDGTSNIDGPEQRLSLMPSDVAARARPASELYGAAAGHCVSLELPELELGSWVASPSLLFEHAVVPELVQVVEMEPRDEAPLNCQSHEVELSHGCLAVQDDRLFVTAAAPALWTFEAPGWARMRAAGEGERFVLIGLEPDTSFELALAISGPAGERSEATLDVHSSQAQAHVVISEVLANPLGSEPAQEWVELFNSGRVSVDLAGFQLVDGGGETLLPSFELAAGAYVVLVNEAYAPGGPDVPLPNEALRLSVSKLGRSGLSNAGERLELFDGEGRSLSVFPALEAGEAGVSWARRDAETLAEQTDGFAPDEAGASPGTANRLRGQ